MAEDVVERRESRCDSCGGWNPVWFAPNALWNAVIGGPEAKGDPGGFLCPICFIDLAESARGMTPTAWKLAPEDDSDLAQADRISDQAAEIERLRADNEAMRANPLHKLDSDGVEWEWARATELAALRAALSRAEEEWRICGLEDAVSIAQRYAAHGKKEDEDPEAGRAVAHVAESIARLIQQVADARRSGIAGGVTDDA